MDDLKYILNRLDRIYPSDIKNMDGRLVPARIELMPADEPGNKTILQISDIKFNIPIQESFFSQQNMKNIR